MSASPKTVAIACRTVSNARLLALLMRLPLSTWTSLSHRPVGYWRNSVTLFEHGVEVTLDNPIAQSATCAMESSWKARLDE